MNAALGFLVQSPAQLPQLADVALAALFAFGLWRAHLTCKRDERVAARCLRLEAEALSAGEGATV